MAEVPLTIPLLISPSYTSHSDPLPIRRPTHIAQWTTPTPAGPSRNIALCDVNNTIWIHTSTRRPPLQASSSSTSTSTKSPTSPPPRIIRTTSSTPSRRSSPRTRDRGGSFASSVITTTSSSSRHRHVSAFSPPPASRNNLPSAVVTSTTAVAAGPDAHTHIHSSKSNVDLRDQLREQGRDSTDNGGGGGGIGLGIGLGLGGRRLNVQGKEDVDYQHSGTTSPRSTASFESSRTVSNRWNWFRADTDETNDKLREQDLKERMEEVEVEREMERGSRVETKEKAERKIVERAGSPAFHSPGESLDNAADRKGSATGTGPVVKVRRVLLPNWPKGRVVCMEVFESVRLLGVLRDTGLLDLISLDSLEIVTSVSLEKPESRNGESSQQRLAPFWHWRGLHLATSTEASLIVADGIPWPCAMPSPNGEVTRVVMLGTGRAGKWDIVSRLELPGQGHIGLCKSADINYLMHFLPFSLTSYPVIFPSSKLDTPPGPSRTHTPTPRSISSVLPSPLLRSSTPSQQHQEHHLKRNRSFASMGDENDRDKDKDKGFAKFLARRNVPTQAEVTPEVQKDGLGEGTEVERDGYGDWTAIKVKENGEGIGVGVGAVDVFECNGKRLAVKGTIAIESKASIKDVEAAPGWKSVCIRTEDRTLIYRASTASAGSVRFDAIGELPVSSCVSFSVEEHFLVVSDATISAVSASKPGTPMVVLNLDPDSPTKDAHAIHPLGIEKTLVVDNAGNVQQQTLDAVLSGVRAEEDGAGGDRLDSPVTVLTSIRRTQGSLVVAGDEDGIIRIWTAESFKLQGSWTAFADPVHQIALLDMPQVGVLNDCLLCTSREGTVAVISLKDMEHLFLIPASRAPLRRLFIDGKDVLLAYANGKARVWNVQTCEFRRSTGLDAAEDMIASGNWAEIKFGLRENHRGVFSSSTASVPEVGDLARLINLDLRAVSHWAHSARAEHPTPLAFLRTLLSMLITFGINDTIDEFCIDKLGIAKPKVSVSVGKASVNGISLSAGSGLEAWHASPKVTGMRQLAIVSLLRPFLDAPDLEQYAAEVMSFYTGSISDAPEPSLDFFAAYYMDSSGDVHQAARMLFKARLGRMSEEEIEAIVSATQADLPSAQIGAAQQSPLAAKGLTLIGGIAMHKFQSINPVVLKTTADSIYLYLSNSTSPHLALAIELASRGFPIWQSYLDPMDLLRLLFHLSTHTPPPATISAQARLAVLHIANINPSLFMSTLSMDILDAKTVEGRTSIMKLCVFMARKKPGVIQNHLPRIAEAVVKSLDPNVGKMRDDVQEAATVILNELVLAFSTIDFHSGTQRLAVGTHEGAVIMYDLKSASRLYVLEAHAAAVSSVTFSPDGRRLVTVSLESGDLTVWKVGSSISGFFNVGGPPRQGGEKGEPFKRIVFKRADDQPLAETSALSDVRIEWLAARKVRVSIRETALTFET